MGNNKTFMVQLEKVCDVKAFVAKIHNRKGRVSVMSFDGYNKIDAHSLLGLFSLNLSEPVLIECEDVDFDMVYDVCEELDILVKE